MPIKKSYLLMTPSVAETGNSWQNQGIHRHGLVARPCPFFPIITRYTTKINNAGTTHAPQPTNASSALFTHIPNVPAASNNESAKTTENANTITAQIDARASSESHDILSSLCS